MKDNSYVIFTFNQLDYAVPTLSVQEIFLLPKVTIIPESPSDIVGIINLRGVIIPIMDLNRRFGYSEQKYTVNDSIIIVNWQALKVGIIVNKVQEVRTISTDEITPELSHDQYFDATAPERFIAGFAPSQDQLITLLKIDSILRYVDEQDLPTLESFQTELESNQSPIFCSYLTPEDREILQNRADHLRQVNRQQELTAVKPLAVVKFSEEFFGIDLQLVREFTNISKVTPIPCAPSHIVGNINFRGEILTLLDLSNCLQLSSSRVHARQKAMVVQVREIVAGITVDAVEDVILLDAQTMTTVPTSHTVHQDYLQGVAPYQGKILSILDLESIFLQGSLVVDEAV